MNMVIACGGTGGHLFPGMAVGEILIERGHSVLLLVSEKEIDQTGLRGRQEFEVRRLPAMAWPRGISLQTLRFFVQLGRARRFCRKVFGEFPPDAVLAMGGFTSAAPLWEARSRGVPSVIHEANAIPGKANRLLSRGVTRIAVGFEPAARYFNSERTLQTGTPIRRELKQRTSQEAAKKGLELDPSLPAVLVMGGSQGAHGINLLAGEAAARLKDERVQWIHLTGTRDEPEVRKAYETAGVSHTVLPFAGEMQRLYSAADLVISRSGASSITEINHFGLPAIYIPYPHAADLHQDANAAIQVSAGAAVCLEEKQTDAGKLASEVRRIIKDDQQRRLMGSKSRQLAVDDAADRLADILCSLGEERSK